MKFKLNFKLVKKLSYVTRKLCRCFSFQITYKCNILKTLNRIYKKRNIKLFDMYAEHWDHFKMI